MINDEDILEKEDAYILDRIREFCLQAEAATNVAAAKQLVVLIDRVVCALILDSLNVPKYRPHLPSDAVEMLC